MGGWGGGAFYDGDPRFNSAEEIATHIYRTMEVIRRREAAPTSNPTRPKDAARLGEIPVVAGRYGHGSPRCLSSCSECVYFAHVGIALTS
jgi:hypothetical protein